MALMALELSKARTDAEALLPGMCVILTPTYVPDGMGGVTETWGTRASGVACGVRARMSNLVNTGASPLLAEGMLWSIYLPYSQEISVKDRVVTGGGTYNVLVVCDDDTEAFLTRVVAVRVD